MHRTVTLIAVIALAATFVGCGGGSSNSNPASPSNSTATGVSIVSGAQLLTATAFNPSPVVVAKGTTVTWTNHDTVTHDSVADGGMWNSGLISPGASFTTTLETAGTFTYHCAIHPGMVGTVTVQ